MSWEVSQDSPPTNNLLKRKFRMRKCKIRYVYTVYICNICKSLKNVAEHISESTVISWENGKSSIYSCISHIDSVIYGNIHKNLSVQIVEERIGNIHIFFLFPLRKYGFARGRWTLYRTEPVLLPNESKFKDQVKKKVDGTKINVARDTMLTSKQRVDIMRAKNYGIRMTYNIITLYVMVMIAAPFLSIHNISSIYYDK